ncbi:MAG: hypothetical protein AAF495_17555 [Pseudomonadota bacterium]
MRRSSLGMVLVALAAIGWTDAAKADAARGFGDWFVACEGKLCAATHETDLVEIEVLFEAGKDPRILFHVAREARRGDPIAVRLADGEHAHLKINDCSDRHCTGEAAYNKLSPETIEEIRRSKGALIAYLVQGVIVIAPISFDGYAEASAFAHEQIGQ